MYLSWILGSLAALSAAGLIAIRPRGSRFAMPLVISLIGLGLLQSLGVLGSPLRESCLALAGIAALQFFCALVNPFLERRNVPRLVHEALLAFGYFTILLIFLSRLGVNVTSIVTTSAVATAAIGFAMQDTLANLAAGITLQIESTICAGEWIRIPTGMGRVQTVRLRHTILETPYGDKVLVPNHLLTKESVVVLGTTQRNQIPLRVQYGPSPSFIESSVSQALCASKIPYVAESPAPTCVLVGFHPDHIEYALVIYVWPPGHEATAASESLTRAFHALSRIDAKLNGFTQTVALLPAGHEQPIELRTRNTEILQRMELFSPLEPQEIGALGASVQSMSFARGELIICQGDRDDSLFIIETGHVEVLVGSPANLSETKHVATLRSGDFFGEMSLFTGEPRTANVQAVEEVCCLKVAKADLMPILQKRPGITREISDVLARRKGGLDQAIDLLNSEALANSHRETAEGLLAKMIRFFGLKATGKSAA